MQRVSRAVGLTSSTNSPMTPVSNLPNHQMTNGAHKSQDIIQIAWLLRQKLPGDLVPIILDYAELWDFAVVACSAGPAEIRESYAGELQAAVIIPKTIPTGALRRVRFVMVSKDQGWSSYPVDHGTYRGSWTWFEAGVRGLDPSNTEDQATIHKPFQRLYSMPEPEQQKLCIANPEFYKYGSKPIVTNIHAGKDWKTHIVEWVANHEDEDVQKIFKELRGGHRIEISAHARFSGWCNHIKLVVIEVEYAVVRKM